MGGVPKIAKIGLVMCRGQVGIGKFWFSGPKIRPDFLKCRVSSFLRVGLTFV